jgi:hypothetical protein
MEKTLLTLVGLCLGFCYTQAQTSVLYQEDWGTTNGGVSATTLASVGWSEVLPPAGYSGIYEYGAPFDGNNDSLLPTNIIYFGGNAGLGIFFTTNGAGSGTYGDSAFTSIDPTPYTNLQFSVESQWSYNGGGLTCWFAVQVGGVWYVATNQPLATTVHGASDAFVPATMTYNPAATNWNILTNSSTVAVGPQVSGNLSGPITGVGVVVSLAASSSWDYNLLQITSISNVATPPSLIAVTTNQTVYQGGGVSFAVAASGSLPFTYTWLKNGVSLTNSARIFGATSNQVTIENVISGDAGSYSVIVSNSVGYFETSITAPAILTVDPVPADYLYAETFPFVGPLPAIAYPLNVVGWSNAVVAGQEARLFSLGGGNGAFTVGEASATTEAFYTDTNLDTGTSGLPFPVINPQSYPAISFSVNVSLGSQPANVNAYFAVQMNGSNWYANTSPILVNTSVVTNGFSTYRQQFQSLASAWNTLTIGTNGAVMGGQAPADLTGNITGAGVVVADTGGGYWNLDNFLIITDSAPPIPATINSTYSSPYSQSVYPGAGVSFAVSAYGTAPLSYLWQTNGVALANGGRISGATSSVLTILNVTSNDTGMAVSCIVSNSAGTDNSANYITTALTVNSPLAGLLYAEEFPFIGPTSDAEPLSVVGWASAIPDFTNRLYQNAYGIGAAFAYENGPATTAFYTTTALDTGVSGQPFSAINPAFYPSITFWVDIAPSYQQTNVTAYFAVQMNGNAWYVSSTNLPVNTSAATYVFSTYTQTFNAAAANWNNLTVTNTGAAIGSAAGANLSGTITGIGLVFVHSGSGGTFDFQNFVITGSGIGGVTIDSVNSGNMNLSWVNWQPNVSLQSTTKLTPPVVWSTVPNTTGRNSATVPITGRQMFFRTIQQ